MSDAKEKEESMEEMEKKREGSLRAIGSVFAVVIALGFLLAIVGASFGLQAASLPAVKKAGAMVGAGGLIFSIGLFLIFHVAVSSSWVRSLLSLVMVFLFLGITGGTVKLLSDNKPEAAKAIATEQRDPVVQVVTSREFADGVQIFAEGVVESQRVVTLTAEISGKVVEHHASLVPGGKVREGELLARLEAADYQAALEQTKATVADAELHIKEEEARRDQALRDWRKLGQGEPSALLSREPQLASARARLESAKAEVARAARNLERTVIRAPFDAVVRAESVEVGAVLAPGTQLATLFSDRSLEIALPLKLADYALIKRDESGQVEGAVTLRGTLGSREVSWPARIVRTTGEIARGALTAGVVAVVEAADGEGELRLPSPGLFVNAELEGQRLSGAVTVPREAIREGDRVAVMNEEDLLEFRQLKVVRTNATEVLVTEGVKKGERVIVTRLSNAVEGMKVAVEAKEEGENSNGRND